MDNTPVMALEEQLSADFHEASKTTVVADSVAGESDSLTDKNVADQTLELKNGGNIERKFSRRSLTKLNRFAPVQVSKRGPCLVPNRKKSVTEKDPSEASTSSSRCEMNGGYHVSDQANLPNNEIEHNHGRVLKVRSLSSPAVNFDSSPVSPSHLVYPYSAPLPVSTGADLPRIVKHKPSSITFADYDSFLSLIQSVQGNESSDTCETSSEDEGPDVVFHDEDGDEVFPEMTRPQRTGFDNHRRKGDSVGLPPISTSSYEAEEDSSSTEVRAVLFFLS